MFHRRPALYPPLNPTQIYRIMQLKNYSIGFRVACGFALVIALVVAIIVPLLLKRINHVIAEAEQRELSALQGSLMAKLESETDLAGTLSHLVAGLPPVQEALAERDRDTLQRWFLPGFDSLQQEYGVKQFQFHLAPATSFLRIHKPEKHGDDLSSLRPTIVDTNRRQTAISGVDVGVAGLGIRGLEPVFAQGQHVGSLEFGMSFGDSFFQQFHDEYGAEAGLVLEDNGNAQLFASTTGETLLPDAAREKVLAGETVVHHTQHDGTPLAVTGRPLTDYAGKSIGVMEVALDSSSYESAMASARNTSLVVAALAIVIGMGLALWLARSITRPLRNTATAMQDIAAGEGDLTRRLDDSGRDELSELARQFNAFVTRMQQTMRDVRHSAHSVGNAAGELTRSSQELATRTDQAAANLHETSSSMDEITSTVSASADSAREAHSLVASTSDLAGQGQSAMEQVADAMKSINTSSEKITAIVTTMDAIAFQTNLLALNASVEAARAGEHGRGFAVVAQEVRTLASRSSDASHEIRDLVTTSSAHTRSGVGLVEEAEQRMSDITQGIDTIRGVIDDISAGATEQSAGITQVNTAVSQMDSVTQQNATMVQSSASSASAMQEHAERLNHLIDSFILEGHQTTGKELATPSSSSLPGTDKS